MFATGNGPNLIAFDGTNIWVANGERTQCRRSTATTGRDRLHHRQRPMGVAFDGTNIWVANYGSNTVSRIDPAAPGPHPTTRPATSRTGWPLTAPTSG